MSSIGLKTIENAVCAAFETTPDHLHTRRRHRAYSWPRFAVFDLARRYSARSLPQIGNRFDMDHTSILHGVRRAREISAEFPGYQRRLNEAAKLLEAAGACDNSHERAAAGAAAATWC